MMNQSKSSFELILLDYIIHPSGPFQSRSFIGMTRWFLLQRKVIGGEKTAMNDGCDTSNVAWTRCAQFWNNEMSSGL
jgi:hypothetical protein